MVSGDGTLWLVYWPGNDALKKTPIELRFTDAKKSGYSSVRLSELELPVEDGVVLEGNVELPDAAEKPDQYPGLYVESGKDRSPRQTHRNT